MTNFVDQYNTYTHTKALNLIVDIGNSQAKLVVFEGDSLVEELCTSNQDIRETESALCKYNIDACIVCSVVPISNEISKSLNKLQCRIIYMSADTQIPIQNLYRTPQTLGVDRLAGVVGGSALKPGCNLLVIDAGTCITYDLLDCNNAYHGGNISPGLAMRLRAMHEMTAKLPLVSASGDMPSIGYDTETAIRSGAITGMKHEIEGYVRHLREKYPDLQVIMTGGDALTIPISDKNITIDRNIVHKGLNKILQHNLPC